MAFVPGHEHDVFVSYAHADNEPPADYDTGWVTHLIDELGTGLRQVGLRDHDVWTDHQLAGNVKLTKQIVEVLNSAATLVVVLSPAYVASEWCRRERDWFLKFVEEQGSGRVFVVERDRVEDRPREFHELKGYKFWEQPETSTSTHVLGTPTPKTTGEEAFFGRVKDLCVDLARELKRLKSQKDGGTGGNQVEASAAIPAYRHTVFLAEVTDELDPIRNKVKRYLDQSGIRALPQSQYAPDHDAFTMAVERDLRSSEAFVQLLSGVPGRYGHVSLQHDLAQKHDIPIIQWRSRELNLAEVKDSVHLKLLNGPTVRAEDLGEFQDFIKRALEERKPEPTERLNAMVFVNMESEDRPLAEKVCQVLKQAGVDWSLPLQVGTPTAIRKDLKDNLAESDGVMIIYGSATLDWVRGRLRQFRKVFAERKQPLRAFAVYQGPPEEKPPLDMVIDKLEIIDASKGDAEEVERQVKAFLDHLRRAKP